MQDLLKQLKLMRYGNDPDFEFKSIKQQRLVKETKVVFLVEGT